MTDWMLIYLRARLSAQGSPEDLETSCHELLAPPGLSGDESHGGFL
jgi:hypothetical protein